jgi:dTDP-glucose 4,6-dehydratase
MRSLLVTGGAGFIGANFVHHWLRENSADRVTVLDSLTYAGNLASLEPVRGNPAFRFVHGSICDHALVVEVLRTDEIDTIVNFAAESHVDRSIHGPDTFIDTNVVGTHCLLKAAREVWLSRNNEHRFHHVSTDEVYGSLEAGEPAFLETTPYAPNSPYSATKAASDHLVRAYHHTYGLHTTISNCSNNYGPFHFPEKLVPLVIVNILEGRRIPVYGDGRNVRDWIHVSDHCRGVELILKRGRVGETYNIGGHSESLNIDLVRLLCRIADEQFGRVEDLARRFANCPAVAGKSCESLIEFVRDRPGHDRRYAVDCSKIEGELGFDAAVSLEQGLRRTFEWYLANESWWREVMNGSYRNWVQLQYGRQQQ